MTNAVQHQDLTQDRPPTFVNDNNDGVLSLINRYWYFERMCDESTDELEEKASAITNRVVGTLSKDEHECANEEPGTDVSLQSEHWANFEFPDSSVDSGEFRRRAELARRFQVPHRVLSGSRFVEGVTEAEIKELDYIDTTIRLLQYQMDTLEMDIIDTVPNDARDALAKLRFISALLIDGKEMDTDHFAYIVRECAECCEAYLNIFRVTTETEAGSNEPLSNLVDA